MDLGRIRGSAMVLEQGRRGPLLHIWALCTRMKVCVTRVGPRAQVAGAGLPLPQSQSEIGTACTHESL